jgi:MOSC domain-containing protein YiiM
MGVVFQINRSNGGVPKFPVRSVDIHPDGVEGDRQDDLKHHGGPDQNLCLFRLETIVELQNEGHPIVPGSTGENVTTQGLPENHLRPGARLRLGEIEIELTDYATPCRTIAESFSDGNSNRISHRLHPGSSRIYARVLQGGRLTVGDPIVVL